MSKRSEVRKLVGAIAGIMVSIILITGSNYSYPSLERIWAQEEGTPLKVALLTDALFSDGGWGATAYNASQALKEKYGLELTTIENVAIPDIEPTLRDF